MGVFLFGVSWELNFTAQVMRPKGEYPEGDAQTSIFTFQQCLKFGPTDDIIQVVTEMIGGG